MARPAVLLALCFGSALNVAAAYGVEVLHGESWERVTAGDAPFGSIHIVREPLPDGNRRITRTSRYLVDLFGQRQELGESCQVTVDRSGKPVSCRLETQSEGGSRTVSGSVVDGKLHLVIERHGSKLERTLPLADETTFSVCTGDVLAALPDDCTTRTLTLIDVESWRIVRVEARRLSPDEGRTRWELKSKGSTELWTRRGDGWMREAQLLETGRSICTASQAEAEAIDYLRFAPRELLMFPVAQHIPFPETVKRLRVKLTWKDTPIESLHLEDYRQRIVRQQHEGNLFEVEVDLTQPGNLDKGPVLPVEDESLAQYLRETEYIRPGNPEIHRQAEEWRAGAETALEAARNLSRGVSEFLQGGEMIADTLSGPEVLQSRKGKCSEFTTLFASLARSIGIPTRVALGMRLSGGQWVGHMWCEAWVGQWIPIDAAADEVGGSPALLKLTHSDTVAGTQPVRWAMTKSLEVEVLEVDREPSHLGLQTGIVKQSYTDADFGCRITARDDWKLEDKSQPGTPVIRFKPPGDYQDEPLIHFVAVGLPAELDPRVLTGARNARFKSAYQGYELVADEEFPAPAGKGRRLSFRQTDPKDSTKTLQTTELIWTSGRSGFILNLIAERSVHDQLVAELERLVQSFELLAQAPAPMKEAKE